MGRPRRPYRRVTRLEQSHDRHPHGGRQMADPAIVSDIPAGSSEPVTERGQIRETARFGQFLLRSRGPFDRDGQRGGQSTKPLQRPVFSRRAGEWMDDDTAARRHQAEVDPRHKAHWRADLRGEEIDGGKGSVSGQGRKKRERQPPHGGAKFVVATAVPGDDPVKLGQAGERAWRSLNSHHIQAGRRYTFDAISKPNERLHGAGHPDFGVLGAQMLQGREADDAVANGSRPDQKRLQRKSTAMRKSTVFGGKHMVSEQA